VYIGAQKATDTLKTAGQAALASGVAVEYCTAMESQQYDTAYALLSKAEQSRLSSTQYATRAAALDTSDGPVVSCQPAGTSALASISGNSATLKLTVTRGTQSSPATGTITLVYEDQTWRVDGADAALKLI
jgi:hypothetical protein